MPSLSGNSYTYNLKKTRFKDCFDIDNMQKNKISIEIMNLLIKVTINKASKFDV